MQAEPDSTSHLNNKGDVDGINFRPSINFKHMKKYRKGAVAGGSGSWETSGARSVEDSSGECQPPLPRDPPPPDSPLPTLKTEVQDEDYQESDEEPSTSDLPQYSSNPKRNMCRDFARGACPYGDKCRFAHEIIVSQLPGIYTFCRDFQNSFCKYHTCKFVHATVFEKEHYFRTGYLPPHAIAHIQRADVPGTGAPPTEGGQAEAAAVYHNLPSSSTGGPVVHPGVSGVAGGGAESRPFGIAVAATAAIPAFTREWRDMVELGAVAGRGTARLPERRKCCDMHRRAKNKLEKAIRSSQELAKKRAAVEAKIARQKLFLNAVMGEPAPRPPLTSIMENLALLLANNDRTPAVEESCRMSRILRWLRESSSPPRHPPGWPGPPPAR